MWTLLWLYFSYSRGLRLDLLPIVDCKVREISNETADLFTIVWLTITGLWAILYLWKILGYTRIWIWEFVARYETGIVNIKKNPFAIVTGIFNKCTIIRNLITFFPSASTPLPSSSTWKRRFSSKIIDPSAGASHASSTDGPTQSSRKVTSLHRK